MATLREIRPGDLPAPLREAMDGHALRRATAQARRFLAGTGIGLLYGAAQAAIGHWHAAAATFGVTAGMLALRLWLDRGERGRLAVMDGPGGRRVTSGELSRIDAGAVGIDRGYAWAVYETPASEPRIMTNAEYDAFRRSAPQVVEVRADEGVLSVGRYTSATLDSSATGLPAIEMFDAAGTRLGTAWYVLGRKVTMGEAMASNLALQAPAPAPSPAP